MPNDEYDGMCVTVLENAQNSGLCDAPGKIFFYALSSLDFILFYFK